jgi:uncharacterized protein YkwD
MQRGRAVIVALSLLATPAAGEEAEGAVLQTRLASYPRAMEGTPFAVNRAFDPYVMLAAVNEARAEAGLRRLHLHDALMRAAEDYAEDLRHRPELSHAGRDGSTPPDRARAAGYPGRYVAESLATGYSDREVKTLVADWLTSPTHRATLLLDRARDLGVARVIDPQSEYQSYWTLLVAAPAGGR